jgi:hypothetical protein
VDVHAGEREQRLEWDMGVRLEQKPVVVGHAEPVTGIQVHGRRGVHGQLLAAGKRVYEQVGPEQIAVGSAVPPEPAFVVVPGQSLHGQRVAAAVSGPDSIVWEELPPVPAKHSIARVAVAVGLPRHAHHARAVLVAPEVARAVVVRTGKSGVRGGFGSAIAVPVPGLLVLVALVPAVLAVIARVEQQLVCKNWMRLIL